MGGAGQGAMGKLRVGVASDRARKQYADTRVKYTQREVKLGEALEGTYGTTDKQLSTL